MYVALKHAFRSN